VNPAPRRQTAAAPTANHRDALVSTNPLSFARPVNLGAEVWRKRLGVDTLTAPSGKSPRLG